MQAETVVYLNTMKSRGQSTMINEIQRQYLQAMDIQLWEERNKPMEEKSVIESETPLSPDWEKLESQVTSCTLCDLHKTRANTVFGAGSHNADLLMIGEAPGANEDRQGKPFVGRAGLLLNSMLEAIGLKRIDIYIANILKCRPPNNRDPQTREVELCTPYLKQQITLIQPKLIVAIGRIAAHFLLNTTEAMGKLRGKTLQYGDIPLIVTYHPAYLLRSPREKAKSYQDFLTIREAIDKG